MIIAEYYLYVFCNVLILRPCESAHKKLHHRLEEIPRVDQSGNHAVVYEFQKRTNYPSSSEHFKEVFNVCFKH